LAKLNIKDSLQHFQSAQQDSSAKVCSPFEPVKTVVDAKSLSHLQDHLYRSIAFAAIKAGLVGAVIMSGGQGTRLGFNGPKGIYDILMPSHKSIFQLHIERLAKVRNLVANYNNGALPSIPVYIMTSDMNHQQIQEFFQANNYFNYPPNDIIFFEQGLEPCFTFDGKIIMENSHSLSLAPDGNGGLYKALRFSGCIDDMQNRGIKHLHIYGIDNVLTKSVDPLFVGLCIERNVECGNKVVWRAHKGEKVGVSAQLNDALHVLEYSEIPANLAETEDSEGKLIFGAANICNHYVSVDFLVSRVLPSLSATYHIAKKKIPYYDPQRQLTVHPSSVNGVKLEMFIFDVFPLAKSWVVVEVLREDEFAPVKNEPGNPSDSPDTARLLLHRQARRWLTNAGAHLSVSEEEEAIEIGTRGGLSTENLYEISPLLSYEGEGLEALSGVTIAPGYLSSLPL
jgi:UDP-N-acetylglucosamine/UDP-N-acetylgalactosamine diphosphorylase